MLFLFFQKENKKSLLLEVHYVKRVSKIRFRAAKTDF